jgi:hypothetical protein
MIEYPPPDGIPPRMPPSDRLTDNGSEEQGGGVVGRVTEQVTRNESKTAKSLASAQVKF